VLDERDGYWMNGMGVEPRGGAEAGVSRRDEHARVLIVGCGAVGGIYAAHLAAVAEVAVLDAWQEHVDAIGGTWVGPHRAAIEDARRWGALLRRAGMAVEVLDDPRGAIWGKLIFNAAVNPLPVLTGLRLSAVYAHPEAYALLRTLVEEGKAVAAARGITLLTDPMDVIDAHRALGEGNTHWGSMKQDIDRGRPTEIETLTGALLAEADRAGVDVPALRAVYRLVKAVEARARGARTADAAVGTAPA